MAVYGFVTGVHALQTNKHAGDLSSQHFSSSPQAAAPVPLQPQPAERSVGSRSGSNCVATCGGQPACFPVLAVHRFPHDVSVLVSLGSREPFPQPLRSQHCGGSVSARVCLPKPQHPACPEHQPGASLRLPAAPCPGAAASQVPIVFCCLRGRFHMAQLRFPIAPCSLGPCCSTTTAFLLLQARLLFLGNQSSVSY